MSPWKTCLFISPGYRRKHLLNIHNNYFCLVLINVCGSISILICNMDSAVLLVSTINFASTKRIHSSTLKQTVYNFAAMKYVFHTEVRNQSNYACCEFRKRRECASKYSRFIWRYSLAILSCCFSSDYKVDLWVTNTIRLERAKKRKSAASEVTSTSR